MDVLDLLWHCKILNMSNWVHTSLKNPKSGWKSTVLIIWAAYFLAASIICTDSWRTWNLAHFGLKAEKFCVFPRHSEALEAVCPPKGPAKCSQELRCFGTTLLWPTAFLSQWYYFSQRPFFWVTSRGKRTQMTQDLPWGITVSWSKQWGGTGVWHNCVISPLQCPPWSSANGRGGNRILNRMCFDFTGMLIPWGQDDNNLAKQSYCIVLTICPLYPRKVLAEVCRCRT